MELLQSVDVQGSITALAAERLRNGKYAQIVAGIRGIGGPQLAIFTGSETGLVLAESFKLEADATEFAFGNLDADGLTDVLVVAGGKPAIFHGGSGRLDPIDVPYAVARAATGRFLFDRDSLTQIALLATDGSLHVLGHDAIDSRPFTSEEVRAKRKVYFENQDRNAAVEPLAERAVRWKEIES